MTTTSHRACVATLAVAAMLTAGCSSTTGSTMAVGASGTPASSPTTSAAAPTAPAVSKGFEAAIADVPWSKVGPGWMLAMWSPYTPHRPGPPPPDAVDPDTVTTTLYLVDPTGNRYAITNFPPGPDSDLQLSGWSPDGSHALFTARYGAPPQAVSLDLHTGERVTIPVEGSPNYAGSEGKSLLVVTGQDGRDSTMKTLKRVDLAGNVLTTYPTDKLGNYGTFTGRYVESPDGSQLVLGATSGMVVMGNDGKVIRQLTSPLPKANCWPMTWWAPTVVLASCGEEADSGSQLWEIPVDGSGATALTAFNPEDESDPGFGEDLGDSSAWKLPSGKFFQSAGACGTEFLSRLTPDMHTTRVRVPGVSDSVGVVGASGDDLVLLAKVGCGGTTSLLAYDPKANTSTVLLGPPINGGGVSDAQLFPERS